MSSIFGRPDTMASTIAEAAAHAWWRSNSTAGPEVPLGVIAAVSLLRGIEGDVTGHPRSIKATAEYLTGLDPDGLIALLRRIWEQQWLTHPANVEYSRLLHDWLTGDIPARTAGAVQSVVRAAVDAHLLDYTMTSRREDADLLAWLLQILSGQGASAAKGFFHTPPPIAELLGQIALSNVDRGATIPAGSRIGDETGGGTGTLLRAAAELIRQQGGDPQTMRWFCNDINPLASACVGVNAIVWGLGEFVVVGCADVLPDPMWHVAAMRHRLDAIRARDIALREARSRVAMQQFAEITGITVRWPTDAELQQAASHRNAQYAERTTGMRRHAGVPIAPARGRTSIA
jgi:hypothetical protein